MRGMSEISLNLNRDKAIVLYRALLVAAGLSFLASPVAANPKVDETRLSKAGIRRLESRHLVLYTDVVLDREVLRLPDVFDQAYEQWCDYFGITARPGDPWRVTGCLMKERKKFADNGLLPKDLPVFRHGYSVGQSFWFDDQPTPYYRRHLFLHEGTHAFVNTHLGANAPPWYSEGLAELLGTHRWEDGMLELGYFPKSHDEVPMLGRIRLVQDAVSEGRALSLREVLNFDNSAHVRNEPYAWCWALTSLLDNHPRYQRRFRRLHDTRAKDDLTTRFHAILGPEDWSLLAEEWDMFIHNVEHDYDFARSTIDPTPGKLLDRNQSSVSVTVAANQGWQNSGVRLEAGHSYILKASGRYQIAKTTEPWLCEPGGVSIRYYQGKPLGVLLASLRSDDHEQPNDASFVAPKVVGLGCEWTSANDGTLYFRVNDSAAELRDNRGTLEVVLSGK